MRALVAGAGVIGQGWAARFALNGWDVAIYDLDPLALKKTNVLIESVRELVSDAYGEMPASGVVSQISELEGEYDWVQESLPEELSLKQDFFAAAAEIHSPVIASSTSGFKPSELATDEIASRFLVCHPFNPVYLLPLVEIVPHAAAANVGGLVQSVSSVLEGLGMRPLLVKKEIDAHIADRLLEAVWREALWLVKDGVATTADIDDAIIYGFGLRWAQMGLFETYRLAGGEAGMAHFLHQFGPALQWPWSRLTDVPEMDAALVEQIVEQSDEQSGAYSPDQLASIRDRNLVAILKALRSTDWGAGAHLNRFDR